MLSKIPFFGFKWCSTLSLIPPLHPLAFFDKFAKKCQNFNKQEDTDASNKSIVKSNGLLRFILLQICLSLFEFLPFQMCESNLCLSCKHRPFMTQSWTKQNKTKWNEYLWGKISWVKTFVHRRPQGEILGQVLCKTHFLV